MPTINRLTAGLKQHDILTPRASHLRDMITDVILSREVEQSTFEPEAVRHLCRAYRQAALKENPKEEFLTGQEARIRFYRASLESFRSEFPQEPKDSENIPGWPDCLPDDELLPGDLLDYAGFILGYRTAQSVVAWEKFCAKGGSKH